MYRLLQDVINFHNEADLYYDTDPTAKHSDERDLQIDLIEEEFTELRAAYKREDLEGIADAITDLMYVVVGAYLRFGMAEYAPDLWNEVHVSNMTKVGGPTREDGKQIKGEDFSEPQIKEILDAPPGEGFMRLDLGTGEAH